MQPKPTPNRAFHNFGELRNYEKIPKKGDVSENLPKGLIHGYYVSVSYIDTQIELVLDKLDELGLAENTIVVLLGDHGWNIEDHKLWSKHVTFKTALRTPIIIKVPGKTNGEKSNYITEFIDIYSTLCELAGIEIPKTVEGKSFVPIIKGKKSNKK